MLRGGAFKPRTSPFAFKGLGPEALEILAEARAETGLPGRHRAARQPARRGRPRPRRRRPDRRAQHAELRAARGRRQARQAGAAQARPVAARSTSCSRPPTTSSRRATRHVILCERGIRTFETATRFTLDLGAVPWLKLHTHLPVIVDPSHAAGDRRLVEPLVARGRGGRRGRDHRRGPRGPRGRAVRRPAGARGRPVRRLRARRRRPRGAARKTPGLTTRSERTESPCPKPSSSTPSAPRSGAPSRARSRTCAPTTSPPSRCAP